MTDMWLWTCENCDAKTATECDKLDAADVRCAMCGSALVGDEQKGMAVVKANRLAALERLYEAYKKYHHSRIGGSEWFGHKYGDDADGFVKQSEESNLRYRAVLQALADLARLEAETHE